MRTCFSAAWLCFLSFPLARAASTGERIHKVTTVVRADMKTGRRVRNVVVTPKPVVAKVVQPRKPDQPPVRRFGPDTTLREIVRETARVHNLEPALVEAVVEVESNYNPFAISSKGAEGLMQLMPSTARRFGVGNSFDAEKNIEGGVRYLKYLQSLYGNDLQRVLAAYNAGEGAVNRYTGIPRYR